MINYVSGKSFFYVPRSVLANIIFIIFIRVHQTYFIGTSLSYRFHGEENPSR